MHARGLAAALSRLLKKAAHERTQPAISFVVMKFTVPYLFEVDAWRVEGQAYDAQAC